MLNTNRFGRILLRHKPMNNVFLLKIFLKKKNGKLCIYGC